MSQTVYHYAAETGEYTGTGVAQESPLEQGVTLMPVNATQTTPPKTGEHQAAVFKGKKWEIVADWRGTKYWLPDGSEHEITALGETLPEGALPEAPPPPPPTPEEIQAQFTAQIQKRLDDFAATRGYDGILSAASYATSTLERFQADGQYCVRARDETWSAAYQILDDALSGKRPVPESIADIEADLPALNWPE